MPNFLYIVQDCTTVSQLEPGHHHEVSDMSIYMPADNGGVETEPETEAFSSDDEETHVKQHITVDVDIHNQPEHTYENLDQSEPLYQNIDEIKQIAGNFNLLFFHI